jgi:SecD/SecF fusion protein
MSFHTNATNDKVYTWLGAQSKQSVSRAYQIINQRIDQFGVVQPNVQELGNGRILVELPGVKDPKRVRNIIQSSAKLRILGIPITTTKPIQLFRCSQYGC